MLNAVQLTVDTHRAAKVAYRRDLDGMRAVAVLLVLFNHLHTRFTGGYVGVDVFFVLSGYLISATILREMERGTFSVISFYERRIRRIFPALLVMLAGATALAYRYFVPAEMEAFARSSLAAVFSVSNLLFSHQAGYFDAPSDLKPLLHTWSLAVEEQFYLFFPIFLVIVRRWLPARLKPAILTAAATTFVLACFSVRRDPSLAFYSAPLRAWELLLGTIVSQHYLPAIKSIVGRNLASAVGLATILIPALTYQSRTTFPGLAALPPCLGAALIIAAGETGSSLAGRALSWRPVVFVGLISYSLYLWHWPVLVFQNTSSMLVAAPQGTKRAKLAVILVSMALAILSWRFVETPFRKGRWRPGTRSLFLINGMAVVILSILALGIIASRGMPGRFPPEALAVAHYASYDERAPYREGICFIGPSSTYQDFNKALCLKEDSARRHFLLLGDSHAAHLYPGLAQAFPEINLSQANVAGCRPYLAQPSAFAGSACTKMVDFLFNDYVPHHPLDTVLLAARWEVSDFPNIAQTIDLLKRRGMRVIVFGPVIEYDAPLPRLLAASLRAGDPASLERHRRLEPAALDRTMAVVAREVWKVSYISAYEDLCGSSDCPVYAAPGVPLLFDTDHFTAQGSLRYAIAMRRLRQLP